ncbi:MAG: YncE family protein [Gammaproteobacteria bacterium]
MQKITLRKQLAWLVIFSSLLYSTITSANDISSYTLFEAGQVRPLALSSDGKKLFALNTPDGRLEIFNVYSDKNKQNVRLKLEASVPVGLEPVALSLRSDNEVWVVNHLSDSVSIVKLGRRSGPYISQTLLVGDEPRDIVFAGHDNRKAFITTAHRGQNLPQDAQLTTPGVGRADVWVYDANLVKNGITEPLNIITLFTDTPRALAVSADGSKVYAAGFKTGNQTTTIHEIFIPDGGEENGGLPSTREDAVGEAQPEASLIVKYDGQHWVDELGGIRDDLVNFKLPDKDVFVIDALANIPDLVSGASGFYSGVGTVLFNMIVNPVNGAVYVTNTDARNENRFEGPGLRLGREHTVQGNFIRNRISILKNNTVTTRHLNKHIDYDQCCAAIPNAENALSIAQPLDMAITKDGKKLFVAGFGSQKVVMYDTEELENDSFEPNLNNQIILTGGGPSGLVLDEKRGLLFTLTRFDNAVAVIDIDRQREIAKSFLFNPEPEAIVEGRRFLYDATISSSHGDSSCGGCHIFGDMDALAWDLGDPDEISINNPGPFKIVLPSSIPRGNPAFRALKGPMTTQSLRGMANHGPMHWRGDRTGGNDETSFQPDGGSFNEEAAFKKFNVAFEGLNGRNDALTDDELQAFTDFVLQLTYPPNPIRNLDNSLTAEQQAGKDIYFGEISDRAFNCNGCHVLDRNGNAEFGVSKPGFFGTDGKNTFVGFPQYFKIPHIRNMYQKVGMFGMPQSLSTTAADNFINADHDFMGDQIRGFGFTHDGALDTLFRFFGAIGFVHSDSRNPGGFPFVPAGTANAEEINAVGIEMRRNVEAFVLAADSNLAPIVGQQTTLTFPPASSQLERLVLLKERADAGECDLVASQGRNTFLYETASESYINADGEVTLFNKEKHGNGKQHYPLPVTFTCAPVGSGNRLALDRDQDGLSNTEECRIGSDPSDANSNLEQGYKYTPMWKAQCIKETHGSHHH